MMATCRRTISLAGLAAWCLTAAIGAAATGGAAAGAGAVEVVVPRGAAQDPQAIFERAVAAFGTGRLQESAAAFDRVAALLPGYAPQLWQRGIALYYVGRYEDCRAQFESHRTVNPNDVENAAWHFLCVARADSVKVAREALLPVGPDRRAPMAEIYAMFRGDLSPGDVMVAAGDSPGAQFYAFLYIGLYHEAAGRADLARENITAAAAEAYASVGGYMHMVARVHRDTLMRQPQ
jgi:lipoprotein NlpI